jgi:hypothetical protein
MVSRWFIGIGLALVVVGLVWPWLGRLGPVVCLATSWSNGETFVFISQL